MQSSGELRSGVRRAGKAALGLVALATLAGVTRQAAANNYEGAARQATPEDAESAAQGERGAVYTETNTSVANAVVVFDRAADGKLTPYGTFFTGGDGTGKSLGAQGEVILSPDNKMLFAVNAGSNEISVFAVRRRALILVDKVASGGMEPVSLTLHDDLLYVLNRGGSGGVSNITGFKVATEGKLSPISNSTQLLSTARPDPPQVGFSPNGKLLIVTEKATNLIDTFVVRRDGRTIGPIFHKSSGQTPFGFSFGPTGEMIVSEAFGGAPNASAISLYVPHTNGALDLITGTSPTHQTAACWSVTTEDGKYTYTTNTGSGTVSGYYIDKKGGLTLLNADGVTGGVPDVNLTKPTDMALTPGSHYLYALQSLVGGILEWRVEANGSLPFLGGVTILPVSSCGLAAR